MISIIDGILEFERSFSFDKEDISEKIKQQLIDIEDNKRKWKSLYLAVWGLPLHFLKPKYIDMSRGDELIHWGLPRAKFKKVAYTPNELNKYLTNYDKEIHISQIIKIFILLENYFFAYHNITKKNMKELKDLTKFSVLKKYLEKNKFANDKELLELEYAKETRNSFVHRRGLVNEKWLEIHKKTKRNERYNINDNILINFHDLEDWTDLMITIVKRSLKKINRR